MFRATHIHVFKYYVTLYDEKYLPSIRRHVLLTNPQHLVATITVRNCSAQ